MFVWNTTPWECFSRTAGWLTCAAEWKQFVMVAWGRTVGFPLTPPLFQVLLFQPISCASSIWTAIGRLRAVRTCCEDPRQRREAGMPGYGGVWQLCVFACEKLSMCALSQTQNALHTMDMTRRVNPGHIIITAVESMLDLVRDVTWGFESDLALFAFDVLTQEQILEQVPSRRSFIWVRLEAGKDEGFGLWRKRLWDLRMDLKHAHLVEKKTEMNRGDALRLIIAHWKVWTIHNILQKNNASLQ